MDVLYLDLGMGAAGDMLSAALYELLTEEQKKDYLEKVNHLGLAGVTVRADPCEKCGIAGTHMTVLVDGGEEMDADHEHEDHGHAEHHLDERHHENHGHAEHRLDDRHHEDHGHAEHHLADHEHEDHGHVHHHSSPAHINAAIAGMDLPDPVKKDALGVYDLLARAESHAHHTAVDEIHFHEVGEKDAIVDIVSVCLLMDMLKPGRVIASPAATGSGTVRCAHGSLPVPAPATAFILQEKKIPCTSGDEDCELLTPTGAALTGYFADSFGKMPAMTILRTGYGMGKRDFARANCVRAILGESTDSSEESHGKDPADAGAASEDPDRLRDTVLELSCNLDDMTPEDIGFAQQKLFETGALDVFTCPIGMKKNRPGILLTVLCHNDRKKAVTDAIFRFTTTIGIREKICGRYIMRSESKDVDLYGDGKTFVKVKVSTGYGQRRVKPEFDQIAEIADKEGAATAEIRRQVLKAGENLIP